MISAYFRVDRIKLLLPARVVLFDPLSLLFQLQSVVILFPLFDPMSQWKKEFLFVGVRRRRLISQSRATEEEEAFLIGPVA